MKKYLASEIVERAKDLADISHSDIVSWKEDIDYLNDAWKELYQAAINKHDLFFIKEVAINAGSPLNGYTEYELPEDVYQVESITNPRTGEVLTRHVQSEGYASGYSIVNNKLRIYGQNVHLVMRYWLNPMYITFPDKRKELSDLTPIISSNGNYVLYQDGRVVSILNEQVVGNIDQEGVTTTYLGQGHAVCLIDGKWYYVSFDGNIIAGPFDGDGVWKDQWGLLYIHRDDKLYKMAKEAYSEVEDSYGLIIGKELYPVVGLNSFEIVKFENEYGWLVNDNDQVRLELPNGYGFEVDIPDLSIEALTAYGPISSNGTARFLTSLYPDTLMNLPNELFFSMLSAQLAVNYMNKQNAMNEGVMSQYQEYMKQYFNSLSQDAGYGRIINVY